ncbi:uncharacterized protein LOC113491210 [Athene cunicularia]|uniref:uncharacterized protein LOC113491210 n=1 Tax=Athene cunicularia TaxID=194338 RepID=UPI000EF6EE10|nr:uncharacterized protein LOC113491210 [Athene cunicularia]
MPRSVLTRCWPGNGPSTCQDGALPAQSRSGVSPSSTAEHQDPSEDSLGLSEHGPEPHQSVQSEASRVLSGMGQLNCCRGSRVHPYPEQHCEPVPGSPELLLRQRVRVTQGRTKRKRDLLLSRDTLVIAKSKRGSAPCPQHCLALGQLQVLSSKIGEAGDGPKEQEDKSTNSLVLVWPSGSCVVTFHSRAEKELWVSALQGPPEGVEGARVTQLPSITAPMKELSRRKAVTTLRASSLERLVEGPAKAGAEQQPPPVVAGSKGGHGPSAGEFGEEGGRMAFLSSSGRRALVLQWGCCPPLRAPPSPSLRAGDS